MKEMIKRVREEKGGFTLAELLIVVAIVLVLVAIAVPVFTGALSSADDAVGKADSRTVKASGSTKILLDPAYDASATGPWYATADFDANGNMTGLEVSTTQPADWASYYQSEDKPYVKSATDGSFKAGAIITSTDVTTTS